MAYGYNEPFGAAPPVVQIKRVGGWKLLFGTMLAAAGLGFAAYVYMVPYQGMTKTLHAKAAELSEQRAQSQALIDERDKLKGELTKRAGVDQDKAEADTKKQQTVEALGAELKPALTAIGANVAAVESRPSVLNVSFTTASLFDQPTSTVVSPQGDTTLKILAAAVKKAGMKARVRAKLSAAPPPRELGQFKNIGEFVMLRAARIALSLTADGLPASHVAIAGVDAPAPSASKKAKPAPLPDHLDVEIEPE